MKNEPPFGVFEPRGLNKMLVEASRHTVLGHAEFRKLVWWVLSRRSQKCFDVSVDRARMRLHPRDSSIERALLLRPHKYCPGELAFLRGVLRPGSRLVDAGANVGIFTLLMAPLPHVSVVAIEPSPTALERLRFNVAASGYTNVDVAPVALAAEEGLVRFFVHGGNLGLSGIGEAWDEGLEIDVPAKTFSSILDEYAVHRPYVLKIDIERHEDAALMPFFRESPRERWPDHVLIETIGHHGVPACVGHMLANGYRKAFQSRQNTGLSYEG